MENSKISAFFSDQHVAFHIKHNSVVELQRFGNVVCVISRVRTHTHTGRNFSIYTLKQTFSHIKEEKWKYIANEQKKFLYEFFYFTYKHIHKNNINWFSKKKNFRKMDFMCKEFVHRATLYTRIHSVIALIYRHWYIKRCTAAD